MRTLSIIGFVFLLCLNLNAQTVSPDSAKYYEGSLTTVCGKVYVVHTTKKGVTFINFGAAYPLSPFTAVIFASDSSKFKDIRSCNGKKLCVMGTVKIYDGKPEIILKSGDQIRFPDEQ